MTSNPLQKLVDSYCENTKAELRGEIIIKYTPLVRNIVSKINRPNSPLTQHDYLESEGIGGLIQALETYDQTKNAKFSTFAYYRIRGSVIDYLRRIENLSKYKRAKLNQVQKVVQRKSQELGRNPFEIEVAYELDMPLSEYHRLLNHVQKCNSISLDETFNDGDSSYHETTPDTGTISPDENLERKEVTDTIEREINHLDKRNRLILTLYYYEYMSMNEIAMLLELSEARISQIMSKLLMQLKHNFTTEQGRRGI